MNQQKIEVDNGKYAVIIQDDGSMFATRNGAPWRDDILGDNLIYWLAVELKEAREKYAKAYEIGYRDGGNDVWADVHIAKEDE